MGTTILIIFVQVVHQGIKKLCDECDYVGTTILIIFVQVVHQGIKKLCDECDYVGTTIWSLRKHKNKHHDKVILFGNAFGLV